LRDFFPPGCHTAPPQSSHERPPLIPETRFTTFTRRGSLQILSSPRLPATRRFSENTDRRAARSPSKTTVRAALQLRGEPSLPIFGSTRETPISAPICTSGHGLSLPRSSDGVPEKGLHLGARLLRRKEGEAGVPVFLPLSSSASTSRAMRRASAAGFSRY